MKLKWLPEYLWAIEYNSFRKTAPLAAVSLLVTGIELLSIALIFPIIQAFLDFDSFSAGRFSAFLGRLLNVEDMRLLSVVLVGILAGTILLRGAVAYFGYRWVFHVITRDEAAYAARQYRSLLSRDYLVFQGTQSSKIIRDIAIAIPLGFSTVLQALLTVFSESFVFIGISIYLFILNPAFFTAVLVILSAAAIIYAKIIGPVLTRLGRERHELSHKTIGIISESLEGIVQLKNWQSENFFARLFLKERLKQSDVTAKVMATQNIPRLYFESIVMLMICGAMGYFMLTGTPVLEFLPILGFYVVAAFRSLPSVLRLSAQFNVLSASRPAIETILAFKKEKEARGVEENIEPLTVKNSFELRDLYFSYDDTPVINGLSLSLRKGEMIGLAGRSGEGKTTLVNIMAGLLTPQSGEILVDGQQVFSSNRLLATIGYVSQNTFLLNDSVRANIAFGVENEDVDDHKVKEALRFAQLQEFVDTLPSGADEIVGERGGRLSGGQRQRIGIARAFYFDRDILVLDEATASLDEQTEKSFCEVLRALKGQKTVIVISHKPEPLSVCDRVYDMKAGKLISDKRMPHNAEL